MSADIIEALSSGLATLWDYVSAHTVTCLVPAFFIAGAIAAFVKRDAILRYLGPRVPRRVSYPIASISGTVLAVCSCTILPLFAGIYKKGAGIGPASAFLYSGPAINIIAIGFTASALGYDLGAARAVAAVLLAVVVGLVMAAIFGREEREVARAGAVAGTGAGADTASDPADGGPALEADGGTGRSRWLNLAFFAMLVAILVVGTAGVSIYVKGLVIAMLGVSLVLVVGTRFERDELEDWGYETWDLAKKILPILLVGAFVIGVINHYVPADTFTPYLGSNDPGPVLLASVLGGVLYMPTLLEVPLVGDTFGYTDGLMAGGPALALLLAGPAVSLPNMIVLYRLVGARRTAAYIAVVVLVSALAGMVYGALIG